MKIGLLGGSFNPPHEGHRHISLDALRRLGLDRIWWIVTPGNPLKSHSDLASLSQRIEWCEQCSDHPAIDVTGFEQALSSPFTFKTISYLTGRFPDTSFVWLMGADNMAGFHRWRSWRELVSLVPIAVFDRPGYRYKAVASRFAKLCESMRVNESKCLILSRIRPPAWTLITSRLYSISSTEIRNSYI